MEFIEQNPVFARYVINSTSSALAAQLQGKELSDTVLESIVRTTASVLNEKFQDAQTAKQVEEANKAYTQAEEERQNIERLAQEWEQQRQEYEAEIASYEKEVSQYNRAIKTAQSSARLAKSVAKQLNDPELDRMYGSNAAAQRATLRSNLEYLNSQVERANKIILAQQDDYESALANLKSSGFIQEQRAYERELNAALDRFNSLSSFVESSAQNLTENSANLFTDFETELATTLAPLTAFEETDVTDQELLAEISPVAPPTELAQGLPPVDPFAYTPPTQISQLDPNISAQAEEIAREEFAKVAQGEEVAALPAVAIPAAANVLTRTAIQAAPAVVRKIGQFAANDPRFAQAVVENPYIQELLRAASLTAALGPNGELLINPIVQENESAAESARLYRYATQVQSEAVNGPPTVIQAHEREARRFEDLAAQQDIENLSAQQPDMEVELTPEV
jgi:hypothetical protein